MLCMSFIHSIDQEPIDRCFNYMEFFRSYLSHTFPFFSFGEGTAGFKYDLIFNGK